MKIQKTRSFVPSVRKLVITRPIVFIINHQTLLTLTTLNQVQILKQNPLVQHRHSRLIIPIKFAITVRKRATSSAIVVNAHITMTKKLNDYLTPTHPTPII
jgi:hypothetical protein